MGVERVEQVEQALERVSQVEAAMALPVEPLDVATWEQALALVQALRAEVEQLAADVRAHRADLAATAPD